MAISTPPDQSFVYVPRLKARKTAGNVFQVACLLCLAAGLFVLLLLLIDVFSDGLLRLFNPGFLTELPSRFAARAGIRPALLGTLLISLILIIVSVPIGVGAALYLEEYAQKNRLNEIIEVNIANLAGVPSIVYGILGLGVFNELLRFGPALLSGALTLSLLVLPMIIVASREAIRAVPSSMRQAAYGLGATKWQTVSRHVLPYAVPGILTGVIIAVSRAIGETAPLIVVGAVGYVTTNPGLFQRFSALPIQIYEWISRPQPAFHNAAAAGIIVLLISLLLLNSVAIYIRNKFSVFK